MDKNKEYVLFIGRDINAKPCGISLVIKRDSIQPVDGALIQVCDAVTAFFKETNKDVHVVSCDECTSQELGSMIFKNCMTPNDRIFYIY